MGRGVGVGGGRSNGTLRRFLGKRVLVIFKHYSIRLNLKNYIATIIYFLLMFCSLSTFFLSLFYDQFTFIYLFINYLFKRRVENAFGTSYIVVYK